MAPCQDHSATGVNALRKLIATVLVVPVTILFATGALLSCLRFNKSWPTWFMHSWGKTILWLNGMALEITGIEHVEPERPAIYMANHASMLDIPVLIAALPVHLRFIFKKSILLIPFLGQAIYAMGMIPIDRGNRHKASRSLRMAGDRIRGGFHVLIFPEGTRTSSGQLLPFKKGGFRLALEEGIDIVPITLCNTRALCGRNSIVGKSGTIRLIVHDRIEVPAHSLDQRQNLIETVRGKIASAL